LQAALVEEHPSVVARLRSPYRFLAAAVILAAVVLAFVLGRVTAPENAKSAGIDCSLYERAEIDASEASAGTEGRAYYSECELLAARPARLTDPWGRINIYAARTGGEVVAWWYQDCGIPEGIVAVGSDRPKVCGARDTTAATAATTALPALTTP
jgi:hypothetical protein